MSAIVESNEPMQLPAPSTPAALIEIAVRSGASVETLERLMALQERHQANEARRQYVESLARFKALGLYVKKNREVNQGQGRPSYRHATLDNIIATLSPALAQEGLNATWSTEQHAGGGVTVTCILRHAAGHSESVSLTAQLDTGPGRNAIQSLGSSITYLQRYTLMAITGVAASDQDDDGAKSDKRGGFITPEQLDEVTALMHEVNADFEGFLRFAKVAALADIPKSDFRRIMAALEAKRAKS